MKLKKYLDVLKIPYKDFALRVGIHKRYIYGIIRGEYIPSRKIAIKIEEATYGNIKAVDMLFPESEKKKKTCVQTVGKVNKSTEN